MGWFRIDDTLHGHPKVLRAGAAAVGVWALAGSYCVAYKSPGFVPSSWLRQFGKSGTTAARKLVESGLWDDAEQDGEPGYQFHDWDDYQQLPEQIERSREVWRNKKAKQRERSSRHAAGDHSLCHPAYCSALKNKGMSPRDKRGDVTGESPPSLHDTTRHDTYLPKGRYGSESEGDAGRGAGSADPTPRWHAYTPQHHPTQDQLRDGTPAERLHLGWPFDPDKPWLGGYEDNGRIWRTWQMPPWSPHNPDRPQANASTESET